MQIRWSSLCCYYFLHNFVIVKRNEVLKYFNLHEHLIIRFIFNHRLVQLRMCVFEQDPLPRLMQRALSTVNNKWISRLNSFGHDAEIMDKLWYRVRASTQAWFLIGQGPSFCPNSFSKAKKSVGVESFRCVFRLIWQEVPSLADVNSNKRRIPKFSTWKILHFFSKHVKLSPQHDLRNAISVNLPLAQFSPLWSEIIQKVFKFNENCSWLCIWDLFFFLFFQQQSFIYLSSNERKIWMPTRNSKVLE